MINSCGLIPRNRLKWIPAEHRLAHEYCFFLHDEIASTLKKYEDEGAHVVEFQLNNESEMNRFTEIAEDFDTIAAIRDVGRHDIARQVILNTITMAIVSDCAHHIYESLRCFEKRKFIPAFNLLRKPMMDNLIYISWMIADIDDFYKAYTSGDPTALSQKIIGNRRTNLINLALEKTKLNETLTSNDIIAAIYDSKNKNGLYGLFQHSVHLITVDRIEIKTSPENFNFIFKSPTDDDPYDALYSQLPAILLYLSHIIIKLFDRISPIESGQQKSFFYRSIYGYQLIKSNKNPAPSAKTLTPPGLQCNHCEAPFNLKPHNVARLLLTDTYRCGKCQKIFSFPFSEMF